MATIDIQWTNRGDDGFEEFGTALTFDTDGDTVPDTSRAEIARRVVDHALRDWERVFSDWAEYDDDVFEVEVHLGLPDVFPFFLPFEHQDCGGFALPDSVDRILGVPNPFDTPDRCAQPRPTVSRTMQRHAGMVRRSDSMGALGVLGHDQQRCSGLATSDFVRDRADLYGTVVHEVTHLLGLLPTTDLLLNPLSSIHVAAAHEDHQQNGLFFGSDGMNPAGRRGTRTTPSLLTATVLASVYGHQRNDLGALVNAAAPPIKKCWSPAIKCWVTVRISVWEAVSRSSFANPAPQDILNVDLTTVGSPEVIVGFPGGGQVSSTTHESLSFRGIELVQDASGNGYDLIVDNNSVGLGGNDGLSDELNLSSGLLGPDKTLDIRHNDTPVFSGLDADIHRLLVKGSSDDDALIVEETEHGLPTFAGDLSSGPGHTNAAFTASGLLPQNVGLHFDGGANPGHDGIKAGFVTPVAIAQFPDMLAPLNSGVINLDGHFTMSYQSLDPIDWQGTGGTVAIDARLLSQMTWLQLLNLGGDDYLVDGDGGFERTSFRGLDRFSIRPPDGLTVQSGVVVNSTGDAPDARPGDGRCQTVSDLRECTLRAAIEETNASAADVIRFGIPGAGPHSIQPRTALPDITAAVTIDGYSQPGAAFNTLSGASIIRGNGNTVLANSIHSNQRLGIDLGGPASTPDGVTPNDPVPDADDDGGNRLQNYPVLTSAIAFGNQTRVEGRLHSAPGTTYLVHFFANTKADESGHGEGE